MAQGRPMPTSSAWFGPERATMFFVMEEISFVMPSERRWPSLSARPLEAQTTMASFVSQGAMQAAISWTTWEGVQIMTQPAPLTASSRSLVMRTTSGIRAPGRYSSFTRVVLILSAVAGFRQYMMRSSCRPASSIIMAVPQPPAPIMAIFKGITSFPWKWASLLLVEAF